MRRTRRDFTFLGLAACVAAPRAAAGDRLTDAVRLLFDDPDSAAAIGRAYLSGRAPVEPASLVAGVMRCLGLGGTVDRAALAPRFRDQITRDFAAGNVVMVDGWMLSSVEAGLCAIVALSGFDPDRFRSTLLGTTSRRRPMD